MFVNELTVEQLKRVLDGVQDDVKVYVGCKGYTNYTDERPSTYVTVNDKGLFISDEHAVDLGNGEQL